jgi:hypothetical protein
MASFLVLTDSGVILASPGHCGDYVVGLPGLYTTPGAYYDDRLQEKLQPGEGL